MNGFEIQAVSDQDYEDLVAEVLHEGELCCLLSQEDGFDRMRLELHPRGDGRPWEFVFSEFRQALDDARERLWNLRRTQS